MNNVLTTKNTIALSFFVALSSITTAYASSDDDHDDHDDHRQHGTHDHGHATLNIVQEGKNIELMLESPAANIVGFEHAPSNQDEKQILSNALETLKKGEQLFSFSPAAECAQTGFEIESELTEQMAHNDEHEDGHEDDHKDDHDDDHKDGHEESDHEAHEDDHEGHSDFDIHYQFVCDNPDSLKAIELQFFKLFPLTQEIDAQVVTDKRQFAAELSAEQSSVNF